MRIKLILLLIICCFGTISLSAQADVSRQIENISDKLTDISKSLESLNERLKGFSETFSSNQGLRLSEKQQTILVAFEFLNRAEERNSTLLKLKIELTEKQTSVRLKLAEVEDSLRRESIDRSIALRGTTDAEGLREIKRGALSKENKELNSLLNEIQNSIRETDYELRENQRFLQRIRQRIFPAIETEIEKL